MLVACCNKLAKEIHGVCNIVPLLLEYVVYWKEIYKCICVLIIQLFYRLEVRKHRYPLMRCANVGALLRLCRFLSSAEVSTALRPFYFSVHPDLFGRYPAERVSSLPLLILCCVALCKVQFIDGYGGQVMNL